MSDVPNLDQARAARDEAMNRANQNAPASWKRDAHACVRALATVHGGLTTDDVWALIGRPPEARALGPVMQALATEGVIVRSGEWRQSTRPECHCRPIPLWAAGPALDDASLRDAREVLADLDERYQVRSAA